MKLDKNGYIDPIIYDVEINIGESYLYHDNWFFEFIMHQFIYIAVVIVKNSVYWVGPFLFTNMLGPVIDSFLNHYHFDFIAETPFRGQDTKSEFSFDFRSVKDPYIGSGFINFFIVGELYYKDKGCKMNSHRLHFFANKTTGIEHSQLAISDSAASCIANQVAKSEIGKLSLTRESLTEMFNAPSPGEVCKDKQCKGYRGK